MNEFNKIYDETYSSVFKFILSKIDNIDYVEDIMQNVYLNFYKVLEKKGIDYFDSNISYLIKLSKSELFKYYSLKDKFKYILSSKEDDVKIFIESIPDNVSIEKETFNRIELEQIWNRISKEDLVTQKVLVLYYQSDMKITNISKALNLSVQSVKNKLYRATNKLKKEFGGDINEE